MEAGGGIEPPPKVLQTLAIPLCYPARKRKRGRRLRRESNPYPSERQPDILTIKLRSQKRVEPEVGLEPTTKGYEPRESPDYSGNPKGGTRTHIEWHQKPPPCRSATFGLPGIAPTIPGGVEPPSTASKAAALPFKLRDVIIFGATDGIRTHMPQATDLQSTASPLCYGRPGSYASGRI